MSGTSTVDAITVPSAAAWLSSYGYRLLFDDHEWVTCLVVRADERWQGNGTTRDDAFNDALSKMCPSKVALDYAKEAFLAHATARPLASAEVAPPLDTAAAPPVLDAPPLQAALAAPPVALEAPPGPQPAPVALEVPLVPPARMEPRRAVVREFERATAFRELERIADEMRAEVSRLAGWVAERQRMWILIRISQTRAVESKRPHDEAVEAAAAAIAQRLTKLSKLFWPGSVRALQVACGPDTVARELNSAEQVETWADAAALAAARLAREEVDGARKGLDADGWHDTPFTLQPRPTPAQATSLLAQAEQRLAPFADVTTRDTQLVSEEGAGLLQIARLLRWLRGSVDRERWGTAVGVVRRTMFGCHEHGAAIKQATSAEHRSQTPWGYLAGVCQPEAKPPEKPPTIETSDDDLLAWLISAFARLANPEIAALLCNHDTRFVDRIVALNEREPKHAERNVRSRLNKLATLALKSRAAGASQPGATPLPPAEREPAESGIFIDPRILVHTRGRRALLVSNRNDRQLAALYEELFGFRIDIESGDDVRKIQAACERIGNGSYDFVLNASGFSLHTTDGLLAKAARGRAIYVRVERGRPVACAQALARDLGLEGEDARARVRVVA